MVKSKTTDQEELTQQDIDSMHDVLENLFSQIEIDGTFELVENEGMVEVLLDTKDTGIVIGYHGEILESLQLIASLMVAKKIGKFVRLSIEVGDYKKNRSEYLENLAQQTKEKVLADGHEQELSNLKSWERRIIHLVLQEDDQVVSESVGEGRDRRLVVKLKS